MGGCPPPKDSTCIPIDGGSHLDELVMSCTSPQTAGMDRTGATNETIRIPHVCSSRPAAKSGDKHWSQMQPHPDLEPNLGIPWDPLGDQTLIAHKPHHCKKKSHIEDPACQRHRSLTPRGARGAPTSAARTQEDCHKPRMNKKHTKADSRLYPQSLARRH